MSTIDQGRTDNGLECSVLWRSVAAITLAGVLGIATVAGTGGVAAADPDPQPHHAAVAAKPHAGKRPIRVDIRGVGHPAYVSTKVVRLPDVAPRRAAAATPVHRKGPARRRAHPHPRTVIRCQHDDTDQTEDFGDDGDEPMFGANPTTSGATCPSARDGFDLNRLLGVRSAPRARTRTPG